MNPILKATLKRQLPFLIGGTITGIIMTYYYGFLFTVVANSIIWFIISMIVNKYYWHYTGFRDEVFLFRKYVMDRNKTSAR
jgi:hypothetical protein